MGSTIPSHGGNVSQEARRLGIKENQILDASASLVPFSPPDSLNRYLVKALKGNSLRNYPDITYQSLKDAISNWHDIDPSMVLPGNGAAELLTWAARDASNKGTSALPTPGFTDYERALNCWNGKYIYVPLPLRWTPQRPQAFPLRPQSDVVWITNPHNPTGQLWSRDSIEPLLKNHSLVICDEAFLSLVPEGEQESLIPLVRDHSNLIVIRSLTKLFAIAGLRLGYAISSAQRLHKWQSWRDPWPINGLATAAGLMLMSNKSVHDKWTNKIHNWLTKEGPWFQKKLQDLPGIRSHPSSTNFQLIEGNKPLIELRENLSRRKILIRDCRSFIGLGDNWLRISLQTRKNNLRIFSTMQDLLK